MRRGLMGWDEAELPKSVLEARLERLQDAMAREGLDALLLYTNLVRPAAVTPSRTTAMPASIDSSQSACAFLCSALASPTTSVRQICA